MIVYYTRKQLQNFLKLLHTLLVQMVLHCLMYPKGVSGCSYCYHGGQHVKGKGMKHLFLEKEPELRTHKSHLQDVANTKKHGSFVRGVKSESADRKSVV